MPLRLAGDESGECAVKTLRKGSGGSHAIFREQVRVPRIKHSRITGGLFWPPVSFLGECQTYWSRRFRVGRSSSLLSPSFDVSFDVRLRLGVLGLLVSSTLWRVSIAARRPLSAV